METEKTAAPDSKRYTPEQVGAICDQLCDATASLVLVHSPSKKKGLADHFLCYNGDMRRVVAIVKSAIQHKPFLRDVFMQAVVEQGIESGAAAIVQISPAHVDEPFSQGVVSQGGIVRPEALTPVRYIASERQQQTMETGKYLVMRKDGTKHLANFNGFGKVSFDAESTPQYSSNPIVYYWLPKIA